MNMSEWDKSALQYDTFEKKRHHYEKIANDLVNQLPVHGSSKVLELACGTGACTLLLAKISQQAKIIALDSSKEMIGVAKKNIDCLGFSNVEFTVGDVADLENLFSSSEFELAVCSSAFWHFPDPFTVLTGLHSVLESRGKLGFNLPRWFPSDEARDLYRKKVHEILEAHGLPSPDRGSLRNQTTDYQEILIKAGFSAVKDTEYRFPIPRELTKEWQRSRHFGIHFDLQRCLKRSRWK
jgi:ubiquinone/menaquinone biosynthesis C-methylase UbiE